MSAKKWLMMLAGAVALALALCAGANILIDPFGVFGDPLFAWYSYNETKLGQGRDASKQVIQDNPELAEELEGLIFAALKEQE